VDIRCPSCQVDLNVDARALLTASRTIQCAACGHTFEHVQITRSAPEATTVPSALRAWHVRLTNRSQLQCPSDEELRAWIHREVVTGDCMVSRDGTNWEKLRHTLLFQEMETPTIDEPGARSRETLEVRGYRTDIPTHELPRHTPPAPIILQTPPPPSGFRTILLALLMVTCAGAGWWLGNSESRMLSTLTEQINPQPPPVKVPAAQPSTMIPRPSALETPTPPSSPETGPAPSEDAPPEPVTAHAAEGESSLPAEKERQGREATTLRKSPVEGPTESPARTLETMKPQAPSPAARVPAPSTPSRPKKSDSPRTSDVKVRANLSQDQRMKAGNEALQSGNLQQAIEHFEKAAEQTLSVEPIVKKGIAQMRIGKPEQAMRAFRQALQRNPDYRRTYIALANALEKTGRPREAAHYHREYLRRFPNGSQAHQARSALKRMGQ